MTWMLMPFSASDAEHRLRDAGVAAHADADHRDLHNVRVGLQFGVAELGAVLLAAASSARSRSPLVTVKVMSVCAVLGHVLHDHVDIDAGVGQRPEDRRRDARLVGHLAAA